MRNIPFKQLILQLAEQLGSLSLPINPLARSPAALVLSHTAHYDLMREMVLRIYKENALRNINGPTSLFGCLDAIGSLRGKLIQQHGDIDQIRLIDQAGELVVEMFGQQQAEQTHFCSEKPLQIKPVNQY